MCTVLPGKPLFLPLQKRHLVAKNEFVFSFRPMQKDQQVDGQYANDSCWRQQETAWDSFKNDSFKWFRVNSFFRETITLYTCTFRFNTLQDVFIHWELCYTLHERSFSKIHNRGTLNNGRHFLLGKFYLKRLQQYISNQKIKLQIIPIHHFDWIGCKFSFNLRFSEVRRIKLCDMI